jgi:hypothetical protein
MPTGAYFLLDAEKTFEAQEKMPTGAYFLLDAEKT